MTLICSSSQAPMQPGNTDLTRLALGPPPNALTDLSPAEWQHNPPESEDRVLGQGALTEDILSQEEFYARGMEFLENEDMHTTSAAAVHVEWTCWRYKSEWMCCSFRRGEFPIYAVPSSAAAGITSSAGRTRVNGKALVGRLTAALWCAIFICKHAAAKRAKLEESED
jgi:hypothetical protein